MRGYKHTYILYIIYYIYIYILYVCLLKLWIKCKIWTFWGKFAFVKRWFLNLFLTHLYLRSSLLSGCRLCCTLTLSGTEGSGASFPLYQYQLKSVAPWKNSRVCYNSSWNLRDLQDFTDMISFWTKKLPKPISKQTQGVQIGHASYHSIILQHISPEIVFLFALDEYQSINLSICSTIDPTAITIQYLGFQAILTGKAKEAEKREVFLFKGGASLCLPFEPTSQA